MITWMKDERVISADNFKVLDDNRITVSHLVGRGTNLTIRHLKTQDSGQYSCAVNLKEKPLKVVHKLQIQGKGIQKCLVISSTKLLYLIIGDYFEALIDRLCRLQFVTD